MPKERRSWFRLIFLGLIMLFATAGFTDADFLDREALQDNTLRAVTLDFASRNTANLLERNLFFNIFGLVPTGFQVESIRITNEGQLPINYQIIVQPTAGNEALCGATNLRVMKNWQVQYEGSLSSYQYLSLIQPASWEDLVMVVTLPESAAAELSNQTCSFNFVITSINEEGGSPFTDQEILQNQITTGVWL